MPRLTNPVYLVESRKYLAASYLFVGRQGDAERQFELLLRAEENYELDPVAFPQEVLGVFESVRERLAAERVADEARRRREEEEGRRREAEQLLRERERMMRLEELALTESVERPGSRWIAALPFGIGQFQNGHEALGWTLAISQAALVGLSLTSFFLHDSLRDEPSKSLDERDRESAKNLEIAFRLSNWITTGLLLGVATIGIVDAQLRFVPLHRETRRRDLPPEILGPEVELTIGPTGGAVRVTF